jgi:hypothetical protein
MDLLNVKDKVDWKIRSEAAAKRQGRFRRVGEWLQVNDLKVQDRLLGLEQKVAEVEALRQQVKHSELALSRKEAQFQEHQGHVIRFMDIAQECQDQGQRMVANITETEARVASLVTDNKDQMSYFNSLRDMLTSAI